MNATRSAEGSLPAFIAARKAGFADIAHARRYYARDDQRILALYAYA